MMQTVRGLGVACKRLRAETRWSAATAANRCGVSEGTWRIWEKGEREPIKVHAAFIVEFVQVFKGVFKIAPTLKVY